MDWKLSLTNLGRASFASAPLPSKILGLLVCNRLSSNESDSVSDSDLPVRVKMSFVPVQLIWDQLDNADCRPHGRIEDFCARCPSHDGDNPSSLHVAEADDGRALVRCHTASCSAEEIMSALGLRLHHLFPTRKDDVPMPGMVVPRLPEPMKQAVTALEALLRYERRSDKPSDLRWRIDLHLATCPHCGAASPLIVFDRMSRRAFADCATGCDVGLILEHLETVAGP